MCGIFCCISRFKENGTSDDVDPEINEWNFCKDTVTARGPDEILEHFELLTKQWYGHFVASVLWMQGAKMIPQPCIDSNDNVLLWNGDIFSGNMANDNVSDTLVVLDALKSSHNVLSTLQEIQGPYSFIYFQKSSKLLYFGRDPVGRHSLLMKFNHDKHSVMFCSVATRKIKGVVEVPAVGIFVINLNNSRLNLTCHPWREPDLRFTDVIEDLETNLNIDIDIKETVTLPEIRAMSLHLEPELKDLEYLENIDCPQSFNETMQYLLENKTVYQRVDHLLILLKKSVETRVKKQPSYCKNCIKLILKGEKVSCVHTKVGILFSGGLDSAILAVLADEYVPENESIDLLNVAFEKTVNINSDDKKCVSSVNYDVPDRKTARQTFLELLQICPNRRWNFIEINVTQEELQKYRSSHIGDLVYPLRTILDESLGCAVWFASRAKGVLSMTETVYESPCRILLLGMGADELFGGYMRHRTILKHKGWSSLTQELNVELDRISERNLGRDDRIVSDHGRQSRLPYLDENVIKYVQSLKPWERCYPTGRMPTGLGDKLLLRLLARRIGLRNSANFPKRAFQFGSRIANSKENAKDISVRL